jgi:hypothetical protein
MAPAAPAPVPFLLEAVSLDHKHVVTVKSPSCKHRVKSEVNYVRSVEKIVLFISIETIKKVTQLFFQRCIYIYPRFLLN